MEETDKSIAGGSTTLPAVSAEGGDSTAANHSGEGGPLRPDAQALGRLAGFLVRLVRDPRSCRIGTV